MSDKSDILTRTLARFGLSIEEAEIYPYLLEFGSKSALELSRGLHLARTRVYRLLDKLEDRGLVMRKFDTLGLKFTASPYKQLELLLAQRQAEVTALQASLPAVFDQLAAIAGRQDSSSKVLYHAGIDGLKHVTWNSLRARGKLRIYEVSASMTAFLPQEFSETVREELVRREIHTLQLTNLSRIPTFTKVTEKVKKFWTPRYISPKELAIKSEVLIYNDVTAMYHYQRDDVFCVEVENADLARMQTQLFDFIFQRAAPMKKLDEFGTAEVKERLSVVIPEATSPPLSYTGGRRGS